jgi:hypothetical protein
VPGMQPDGAYRIGGHTFTTPSQASLQKALSTARQGDWWRLASFQADAQCYLVPSRTTPGERYVVTLRKGATRDHPWWLRYECTCAASTSGKWLACWHKAACHYRRERLASKEKVGLPAILNAAASVNHAD